MTDDLATRIFETWERMAPGWEKRRTTTWGASEHVGRQLVEAVAPKPGETILELAGGTGDTGFLVGELVRPGGRVISSDFSPAMVETARRRGAELEVDNVEFRVLDAQALDLPDASIDAIICRWGYMLMPDRTAAFRETRRVLRPSGRLAFSVWGTAEQNPWAVFVARVLIAARHLTPPDPAAPGIFALSDPAWIESAVVEAGFEAPAITEIRMRWPFDSFDDYWTFTLDMAGALSMVIESLPPTEQASVKAAVRESLAAGADTTFELEGLCLNASTRPA